jgi:fructokinase
VSTDFRVFCATRTQQLNKFIDTAADRLFTKHVMGNRDDLTLHPPDSDARAGPLVVLGEVLWDVFPDSVRLGGAPLNFAVHALRLGLYPILISAVGRDELGERAAREIAALGLDARMLTWSAKRKTGTASVMLDATGQPAFRIARPAAYDDLRITSAELRILKSLEPSWLYYGTLFPSAREGRVTLETLVEAMPAATRFYDVNLRPGFDSLDLAMELLATANVVKLNESEAAAIGRYLGFPSGAESFCRSGAERFGWHAACVTLGECGCAMFDGMEFVRANAEKVAVADTVGAGDAFAAAFVYGLTKGWPASRIAPFANRIGALVASRAGAIPDWSIADTALT